MFRFDEGLKVYLHREHIDFRAGLNSLAILVEQALGLNPFAEAVFVFRNPGGIPAPSAMAAAVAANTPPVAPADPMPPSVSDTAPGPLEGMQAGIETPTGADNVAPPVDPPVSNLPQEPMQ